MALWIQNITPDARSDHLPHDYAVKINNNPPLALFQHVRSLGAAECLRAAADAIDAAKGHAPMTHTPTDALRLVNPHRDITENLRQAAVDLHPWFVGDAKTFNVDCALPAYLNDAADEIERLRAAAPASPLPGGGWQDISTAPKDGTRFLWCRLDDLDGNAGMHVVFWERGEFRYASDHEKFVGDAVDSWMPLPAAPTGAK